MKVDPEMRIRIDIYVFITQLTVNTIIKMQLRYILVTRSTLVENYPNPRFLVGFVLLDLQFYVQCFIDSFFSFLVWPLCCLFLFGLRILITPLVSSNSSYPNLKDFVFREKRNCLRKEMCTKNHFIHLSINREYFPLYRKMYKF